MVFNNLLNVLLYTVHTIIPAIHPLPIVGKLQVCVCVCTDTEVGLCWLHKAIHSGAGCLELVSVQTNPDSVSHASSPVLPSQTAPKSTFAPVLPFLSPHWRPALANLARVLATPTNIFTL